MNPASFLSKLSMRKRDLEQRLDIINYKISKATSIPEKAYFEREKRIAVLEIDDLSHPLQMVNAMVRGHGFLDDDSTDASDFSFQDAYAFGFAIYSQSSENDSI